MKKLLSVLGTLASIIYLLNPSAGFLEIIPDNIPFFGNVDEASITLLLVYCLSNLGINLPFLSKSKPSNKSTGYSTDNKQK
ncbi:DUF1232 domain-containing protein [Rubritalea spongiae]|uniref:DUF1232 domain-containing protein n=1 Tax=Rubritalea spongiae TaxID=430797 RepID=A0ABW5E468_9BACT